MPTEMKDTHARPKSLSRIWPSGVNRKFCGGMHESRLCTTRQTWTDIRLDVSVDEAMLVAGFDRKHHLLPASGEGKA
jgi:hypothetical protein